MELKGKAILCDFYSTTKLEMASKRSLTSSFSDFPSIANSQDSVAELSQDTSKRRCIPRTPTRAALVHSESDNALFSPGGRSIQTAGNNERAEQNLLDTSVTYNDPIHNTITMDELSKRIIDTCEFQRLANLKQLGTCFYVFRGATHTRFEHSIGVAHLAERIARSLQRNQPDLKISPLDILCVKISGLCHDLGHGPFSHVYDGVFIPQMRKDISWRHEDGSVQMFRRLLLENDIFLQDYGLTHIDRLFIEEIIGGVKEAERRGRHKDKFYLYDIVNNCRSGLDVDKLDYFQRDQRYANVKLASDFERFMELGRVIRALPIDYSPPSLIGTVFANSRQPAAKTDELPLMICYPEKCVPEAVNMFSVRFKMHKFVYTHKAVKQVEFMICDALQLADPFIKIRGMKTTSHPDGFYKMSEAVECMEALSNLNDGIMEVIKQDPRPELEPAQKLLVRIDRRKLYRCLGQSAFNRGDPIARMSESVIRSKICAIIAKLVDGTYMDPTHSGSWEGGGDNLEDDNDNDANLPADYGFSNLSQLSTASANTPYVTVSEDELIVEKMHIHYGLKEKNPVARMRFYQRKAEHDAIGHPVSDNQYLAIMPALFEEHAVRVFCKSEVPEATFTARRAFTLWCKEARCPTPFPGHSQSQDMEYNLA